MGWNIDFFSVKVLVLLFILLVFLVIALVIVVLEYRIRQRQKRKFTEQVENTRLAKLTKSLNKAKTANQRLEVIDKHAKSLLRERHHITTNHSYSELVKILEQKRAYEYSGFCKKMFEAYYSDDDLSDEKVKELLRMLTRLIRETEVFLDPEKYNVEKLYPKDEDDDGKPEPVSAQIKKTHSERRIEAQKELLEQKEKSIKDQKSLLEEKTKTIKEKEKELSKKEHLNKRLLKQLEEKIKIQEQKINQHLELQKEIEAKLTLEKQKKEEVKVREQQSEEMKKTLEFKQEKENWREQIKVDTVVGSDWLKQRKKSRGTKNR